MSIADDVSAELGGAPAAFSGSRLDWRDLPRRIRERIAELAGAQVVAEVVATSGFSPGFAGVLELADGSEVFVKAVSPEQNPDSPDIARREVAAAAALPPEVPAPPLLWHDDDGDWVLLGFRAVDGRSPELPWRSRDLDRVLAALADLATVTPRPGHSLRSMAEDITTAFVGWRTLAELPSDEQASIAQRAGGLGEWALTHLDDLVTWESRASDAVVGDNLVHGDLRADNVLLDGDQIWLLDWPWAATGAPWIDLAAMLPSVAMQGGGAAADVWRGHPLSQQAHPEQLRAFVTALTGYFTEHSLHPNPPGIPNLRAFQRAQAYTAMAWLRQLADAE